MCSTARPSRCGGSPTPCEDVEQDDRDDSEVETRATGRRQTPSLRGYCRGSRGATDALFDTVSLSAATHCCCSGVIVAEPSALLLDARKVVDDRADEEVEGDEAADDHPRQEEADAAEKSLRSGAMPGPVASIPAHMNSSHPSPVAAMYSMSIDDLKVVKRAEWRVEPLSREVLAIIVAAAAALERAAAARVGAPLPLARRHLLACRRQRAAARGALRRALRLLLRDRAAPFDTDDAGTIRTSLVVERRTAFATLSRESGRAAEAASIIRRCRLLLRQPTTAAHRS